MNIYSVHYTPLSLRDLKDIYYYIAFELKEPIVAKKQTKRIKDTVKGLSSMPNRFAVLEFEPFLSPGVRKMPVDNFLVFYQVNESSKSVTVIRIFYGGRDIEKLL